jgi:hypothetical protein
MIINTTIGRIEIEASLSLPISSLPMMNLCLFFANKIIA